MFTQVPVSHAYVSRQRNADSGRNQDKRNSAKPCLLSGAILRPNSIQSPGRKANGMPMPMSMSASSGS